MASQRINPVNLLRETFGSTGSVYIPSLIIASPGFLITMASTLLPQLQAISSILLIISGIFLSPLLGGANIFYLHRHFSQTSITVGEAFSLAVKKLLQLILASIIISLI